MTAAPSQPLLPCKPTPHKAWSLLPWHKPTDWPYSSGWQAVIDDLRGCYSLPEATTAALVSFEVDRSCLDGLCALLTSLAEPVALVNQAPALCTAALLADDSAGRCCENVSVSATSPAPRPDSLQAWPGRAEDSAQSAPCLTAESLSYQHTD